MALLAFGRWHINHEYGLYGISELQKEDQLIIDENKTFTICQYDDGPVVDLGKSLIFLSSRKNYNGIDIPLLSSPHKKPFIKPSKKYLCSFVGRKSTHPIREIMFQQLNRGDVFLYDGDNGSRFFVKKTLESYISLCPRGYGGSSFRFFESMQLGIVPFLIGDIDTRPFKRFINWDEISFFSDSTSLIENLIV